MMKHDCQALGCSELISRKTFMCAKHWRMVPMQLRSKIMRPPTTAFEEDEQMLDLERARQEVAKKEGM